MVIMEFYKRSFCALSAILALNALSCTATRIVLPVCDTAQGKLKYEVGKSYFYTYESHFDGFTHEGRDYIHPNPTMKVHGNVSFTFFSKCDVLLSIQDMVATTYGNPKGTPTGSVTLGKSHMKFHFNHGLVDFVEIDPSESAWSQNIKRAILSMVQNSGLGFKLNVTREASVYGICNTSYDAHFGKKRINLTACEGGENSDLIAQGIPYHLPHVQNKQIFGFLRPAQFCECSQELQNGILSSASCEESSDEPTYVQMRGMKATLNYSHVAASMINKADLTHLTLRSTLQYNFSTSFPSEKDSKVGDQIKGLLTLLKSDGSNKADIYIQLKKLIKRATNLEKFTQSDLLKDEMHLKTFYDAMAEVATDESIRVLARATKSGVLDKVSQHRFFTTIAFAARPGPSSLSAMSTLVKNIPKSLEKSTRPEEDSPESQISTAQQLLLGASGLAYQFCKERRHNCLESTEYVELVNEIAGIVNIKPILDLQTNEGSEEIQLAVLQGLGNLAFLTPKAVKALEGILSADKQKTPEWLTISALDAFRRHPCEANLKKTARTIMDDTSRTEQIRIAAYLAVTKCLVSSDVTSIHEILKVSSGVSKFIAMYVRSFNSTTNPEKYRMKPHYANIKIPSTLNVDKFSRASQFVEYSMFSEKENVGVSGDAVMLFGPKRQQPEFVSLELVAHIFGKSFNFIEVGLSNRFIKRGEMNENEIGMDADWTGMEQAAAAKDSYLRIFGTTVGLGLETLQNDIQTTVEKMMKGKTASWNLNAIHPSTFLEEELTFPSLMGLPFTFDLDAVEFDSVKLGLAPGKKELMDVFYTLFQAPYDYKVTMDGNIAMSGQVGMSLGANTPIAVGLRANGKLDHKSTFGLELASNEKSFLDAKILLPAAVIYSKSVEGTYFSYQEVNGVVAKLRDLDQGHTKAATVGKTQSKCRECGVTGLKSCRSWFVSRDGFRYLSTFEKSDPKMTAIDLNIKTKDNPDDFGFDVALTTPGSTVQRELKMKYSGDRKQNFLDSRVYIEGVLGTLKQSGKVTFTIKDREPSATSYWLPQDYSVVVEYGEGSSSLGQVAKATASSSASNKVNLGLDITGFLSANGNWTLEAQHAHTDLGIKFHQNNREITMVDDIWNWNSPTEFVHNITHVSKDKQVHRTVTTTTTSVIDVPKRTFEIDAITTLGEDHYAVTKLHADAAVAEDFFNGVSTLTLRVEEERDISVGTLNLTNKAETDTTFTTALDAEFTRVNSKPMTYSSKVKFDWENKEPELYSFQTRITVDKRFKGIFHPSSDILMKKEVTLRQEAGNPIFHVHGTSNITNNGQLEMKSELTIRSAALVENSTLVVVGYTAVPDFRHNWTASVVNMNEDPYTALTKTKFHVTRDNLVGKRKTVSIVDGTINATTMFKDLMDFKVCEKGDLKLMHEEKIDWEKEMTLNDKEFRIYHEMAEIRRGRKARDTTFLLDVSAKYYEEGEQLTLAISEAHFMKYQCPATSNSVNFTISI